MSTIDLVLLGSLCQSPKSAYDLQKQIDTRHLSRWVKIGSFTVYKKVVQYEKKGYVVSKSFKSGNMPEKTVYTVTPEGRRVFQEMMKKFSVSETRIFLDFNAVIVNLPLLDDSSAAEYISNIKTGIQTTRAQLAEQESKQREMSFYGQAILEQQIMLLDTLEKWEENFERQLKEGIK